MLSSQTQLSVSAANGQSNLSSSIQKDGTKRTFESKLAEVADGQPSPQDKDQIEMEKEAYRQQLQTFIQYSNQKAKQITFLEEFIHHHFDLQKMKKKGAMLEIGAGDGVITEKLAPYFSQVVAVEKNPDFVSILQDKVGFIKVKQQLLQEYLETDTHQKFDFILISHVFYYVQPAERYRYLLALIKKLKKGGKLVFIHGANDATAHHYKRRIVDELASIPEGELESKKILQQLTDDNYDAVYEILDSEVVTKDADEMIDVVKFFLLLPLTQLDQMSDTIKLYVNQHLWDDSRQAYRIVNPQDVLIISPNLAGSPSLLLESA